MLVNLKERQTRLWFIGTLVAFVVATIGYWVYWKASHSSANAAVGVTGPHGGSIVGLAYGVAGMLLILFAMFLAAKKKLLRTARWMPRAYWWMQGHIWLGTLSYVLILYHAGFAWGGLLTQVLMYLFTLVVATGIFGLILQQFIPTKILRDVPRETVYEQIAFIRERLREEAANLMTAMSARGAGGRAYAVEAVGAAAGAEGGGGNGGLAVAEAEPAAGAGGRGGAEQLILSFYRADVLPLLEPTIRRGAKLAGEGAALEAFRNLRDAVPASLHDTVDSLQDIVDERRQLDHQRRLHRWLHGWLFVHVPLSYAMTVLAVFHGVYALTYTSVVQ
jgi:hypothetical protein